MSLWKWNDETSDKNRISRHWNISVNFALIEYLFDKQVILTACDTTKAIKKRSKQDYTSSNKCKYPIQISEHMCQESTTVSNSWTTCYLEPRGLQIITLTFGRGHAWTLQGVHAERKPMFCLISCIINNETSYFSKKRYRWFASEMAERIHCHPSHEARLSISSS